MELLERNIETVFNEETNQNKTPMSMMTILLIADQMVSLSLIQHLVAPPDSLMRPLIKNLLRFALVLTVLVEDK